MAAPQHHPCEPWPHGSYACDAFDDADNALIDEMSMVATRVLWALSGRRFGFCTTTVRPCDDEAVCLAGYADVLLDWHYGWYGPFSTYQWRTATCALCGPTDCGCDGLTKLQLWHEPVESVTSVKIDGVTLDEASYRVDDFTCLTRLDGGEWPTTQDLTVDATEPDTFEITYRHGHPVPPEAALAAGAFTCELVKLQLPDTICALPQRITSISRQGVSMALLDPMDFLDKGRTGLYLVDLFLASVNPGGAKRAPGVWRPDNPRSRGVVRTGT